MPQPHGAGPAVSDQAYLGRDLTLGREVSIAPLVFIGDRVRLDDGVTVMPGCYLGDEVHLGAGTLLYPNVTILERCQVGRHCLIHSGTVIGSDGFGFVPTPAGNVKIPQLGTVVIEDEVEIGANCAIDRGALGETRIGRGVKIDNLVHLAHNVTVGEHSLLVAQVGVSGSTKLGRRVILAGQVGLVGHIELGDGVRVGAQSGVNHSVPAGQDVSGSPAFSHKPVAPEHGHDAQTPGPLSETETLGSNKWPNWPPGRTRSRKHEPAAASLEAGRDSTHPAAPLSLSPGGPDHRPGTGQAHRRPEERQYQRALLPGALSRTPHHARGAHRRSPWPRWAASWPCWPPRKIWAIPSVYLMGLDKVRFRQPVVPGDQLRLEVETIRGGKKFWKMHGKAFVDDTLVVEGEMMAAVGKEEA